MPLSQPASARPFSQPHPVLLALDAVPFPYKLTLRLEMYNKADSLRFTNSTPSLVNTFHDAVCCHPSQIPPHGALRCADCAGELPSSHSCLERITVLSQCAPQAPRRRPALPQRVPWIPQPCP